MASLVVLACGPLHAEAVVINQKEFAIDLSPSIEAITTDETQTIDSVSGPAFAGSWKAGHPDLEGFSAKHQIVWIRVTIRNALKTQETFLLESRAPQMNRLDVFCKDSSGWIQSTFGDTRPFGKRITFHRNAVQLISLDPGAETRCFLRYQADSTVIAPISLFSHDTFAHKTTIEYTSLGLYFGGMLVLVGFNLVLAPMVRLAFQRWYCLFVLSAMSYFALANGLVAQFIFPDAEWISAASLVSAVFAFFSLLMFAREFMQVPEHAPALYRWIKYGLAVTVLTAIAYVFWPRYAQYILVRFVPPLIWLLGLTAGILGIRKAVLHAKYFLISWIFLGLVWIVNFALQNLSVTGGARPGYYLQIGVFVEVFVLSFALALRFRQNLRDIETIQTRLAASANELTSLYSELNFAQENERRSIARDLHDHFGQALTYLRMEVKGLKQNEGQTSESFDLHASRIGATLESLSATLHSLLEKIRPPLLDEIGLVAVLRQELKEFEARTGIQTEFTANQTGPEPNPDFALIVFRIFQESLTNVARHAQASRVTVEIQCNEGLDLTISDDGIGFTEDTHSGRLGLAGMRARAEQLNGTLLVEKYSEHGTRVSLRVPLFAQD
ncbi:MAG: hypothetical protein K8S54_04830 [Spirochaetia bacterium]|nr:hypothetical protein [Spirochaetia bacterium]